MWHEDLLTCSGKDESVHSDACARNHAISNKLAGCLGHGRNMRCVSAVCATTTHIAPLIIVVAVTLLVVDRDY